MDLLSVAKLLAPLAPVAAGIAGGAFGGAPGAAIASSFVKLVMGKFGIDAAAPNATTQLSDRIAEAGEETARAKINAAMEQARAEIQGFVDVERAVLDAQVKNLADVNATIRAELDVAPERREHWFFRAWRPAFGWSFVAIWSVFGLALTYVTLRAAWLSDSPLETLKDAWPLFASYFGPGAAVLGVLIPSRSIEKKAAIENAAPMPNAKPAPPAVPPKTAPAVIPAPDPRKPVILKPPGSRD